MKKVKYILNPTFLSKLIFALAIVLTFVAISVVVIHRGGNFVANMAPAECKTVVVVASGDTLGKILTANGVSAGDVNTIANVLKKDAGISTLRANNDKIEFVRSYYPY